MKEIFLKKIKEFKEDDFTKEIVTKLFYAMGYDKVVFNGGPHEKGRDLICWREDEIGDREVAVVQVKMSKLNSSSSSNSSFQTVTVQLIQAAAEEILDDDGKKYLPSTVYFLTPEDITNRHTETISKPIQDNRKIKFIDGTKLYKIMKKYLPDTIDKIVTNPNKLKEILLPKVINTELFNALKIFSERDANKYYSDLSIDYSPFHIRVVDKDKRYVVLTEETWQNFKTFILNIYDYDQKFQRIINLEEIEEVFYSSNSLENIGKLQRLNHKYEKLIGLMSKVNKKINDIINNIKDDDEYLFYYIEAFKSKFEIYSKNIYFLRNNNVPLIGKEEEIIRQKKQNLSEAFNSFMSAYRVKPKFRRIKIDRDLKIIFQLEKEIIKDKETVIEIQKRFILINPIWIEKYVAMLVSKTINEKKLKDKKSVLDLIVRLSKIYENINTFHAFFPNLKIEKNYQNYNVFDIELNVSDFLSNKVNILVEGDAGAGKTTTLQFYTKNTDKLSLYFPLSKISKFITIENYTEKKDLISFVSSMYQYIKKISTITMSFDSFEEILRQKDTSVMFDGIDEVLHIHPWIFVAIQDFSKQYNGIVCTTARIGFINTFNDFVTIRLNSFSSEQLGNFINGWFRNNEVAAKQLIDHIKINNMDSFLRNPLTATILCSLAEKDVPLPKTEINLYEERLRLLYGDYDLYKQIKRTKLHRDDLDYIARKIAYILHSDNKRNMNIGLIKEKLLLLIGEETYSKKQINLTVDNLVRPCNILIEEEPDSYSFGHLRYQEYLVAKELTLNRGIDIMEYLSISWWKGSLMLFSKLADDIEFIIKNMRVLNRNTPSHIDMIRTLIYERPKSEQAILLAEVDMLYSDYNMDIEEVYHSSR